MKKARFSPLLTSMLKGSWDAYTYNDRPHIRAAKGAQFIADTLLQEGEAPQ